MEMSNGLTTTTTTGKTYGISTLTGYLLKSFLFSRK